MQGFALLEPAARAAAEFGLWLPLAVLLASHLFSFLFGAMALGSPVWALVVLLAMKIGLDLKAHVQEHSQR